MVKVMLNKIRDFSLFEKLPMALQTHVRENLTHKIYRNNPVLFQRYVNKLVLVQTIDNKSRKGVLYTVDPVSESVVLVHPNDENLAMEVIMGHAIESISVISESDNNIPTLFLSTDMSEEQISQRKTAVMELLLKNRFPITESNGVLDIQGIVTIEPPYDKEHCISTNEIVLLRIQELISDLIE